VCKFQVIYGAILKRKRPDVLQAHTTCKSKLCILPMGTLIVYNGNGDKYFYNSLRRYFICPRGEQKLALLLPTTTQHASTRGARYRTLYTYTNQRKMPYNQTAALRPDCCWSSIGYLLHLPVVVTVPT